MLPNFLQIFDESSRVASVSVWRINALGWKVVQLLEVGVHHDLLLVGVLKRLGPEKTVTTRFHEDSLTSILNGTSINEQQYNVVLMWLALVGLKWGFGWRASWAVHGVLHGWCMGLGCQAWGLCLNDGGFGCLCFGVPEPVTSLQEATSWLHDTAANA